MGVSYIIGNLRDHGFECKMIILKKGDYEKIFDMIEFCDNDILAFGFYCDNVDDVLSCSKAVKLAYPRINIVLGGPNTKYYENKTLEENQQIDTIICGEGEETFLELAQFILHKKGTIKDIKGIYYRENQNVVQNQIRNNIKDLNKLSFPCRDIHEKYPQEFLYITGSRGCSANCSFCFETINKTSKTVRCRSSKNIVDEMEFLIEKYKIKSFQFTDATFEDNDLINFTRSSAIFNEITNRQLHVNVSVYSRAEIISRLPESYLKKAKAADLESVFIGLESGNETDLKLFNKRATVNDNTAAIKKLKEHGIPSIYGFINFNPYSSYETLKKNSDFLFSTGIGYSIRPFLTRLEVFPQSAIRKRLIQDKLMDPNTDYKTGIYDYEFKDSKIRRLAKIFSSFPIDGRQYGIDHLITLYQYRITSKYSEHMEIFNSIFSNVKHIRNEKLALNKDCFNTCLDMIFNNASDDMVESYFRESKIDRYDVELRNIHMKLLMKLRRIGITV
jgi:radical SAM superfamily enzyme YgiQ (UPF0313 family)